MLKFMKKTERIEFMYNVRTWLIIHFFRPYFMMQTCYKNHILILNKYNEYRTIRPKSKRKIFKMFRFKK